MAQRSKAVAMQWQSWGIAGTGVAVAERGAAAYCQGLAKLGMNCSGKAKTGSELQKKSGD